jgi:hypothetical protein
MANKDFGFSQAVDDAKFQENLYETRVESREQPRGRRRTPDEIRDILITAGVEIVLSSGLSQMGESLTFKEVYGYLATKGVRLTNGSVIGRVFDSQDQFHHQVLLRSSINQALHVIDWKVDFPRLSFS